MLSLICFDASAVACCAGLDLEAARQRARRLRTHPLGRDARRRRGDDARHLAFELVPRLHVGRGRDDHRRAAHRGDVAEVDDADEPHGVDAGAAGDADAPPERSGARRRRACGSRRSRRRRDGRRPVTSFSGLNGSPTIADDHRRGVVRRDGPAVDHERAHLEDLAGGAIDARHAGGAPHHARVDRLRSRRRCW